MPKMKQGASAKAQFKAYSTEDRFGKNKLATIERVAKAQPNNKPLQERLQKALDKGVVYSRNRKSNGHKCKGLYSSLGFEKNQPSELMKKSKLELTWYYGCDCTPAPTPYNGQSMCEQFEALGYEKKKYVRKHKKTAR